MSDAFIASVILALLAIVVTAYLSGRSSERRKGKENSRQTQQETLDLTQQNKKLQAQVNDLNELNMRYLSFMVNMSSIVQRLNMTLTLDEIIASINHLVLSVIPADKVDVFIFDMEDRLLKKVRALGQPHREEVSVPLGEGLVGMAAQEGTVKIRGRGNIESSVQKISHDSHIWMAVPIRFRERLFGVIGIGQVKNPLGNESNIMKMIADIAGVALINRSLLGEAKHEANTDPLTGLHNRRYFHQMAQVLVEKSIREGNTPISIFLFDIDHFKHYNDINGHDEGDKVLKELSKFVREVTRKDSVVARFGGEEFIIMLPGVSKDDAFVYADRLREQICAYPFAHREKQPLGCLSISGGIASFPIDGGSMNRVIKLADTCLYSAKFEGRNRIAIYKPFYFSDLGKEEEKGKVNGHVQENQQG